MAAFDGYGPQVKVFQHSPRKLHLKNNRNINVFCHAAFWRNALVPLPAGAARVEQSGRPLEPPFTSIHRSCSPRSHMLEMINTSRSLS